jgi:hypothetical protein
MAVFGPLALQQFLTFINLRRPSLLLFTLLFVYGFAGAATAYFDLDYGVSAFACGWFLYVLSADCTGRRAYRELTPLFFTLGSGLMLAGVSYHVAAHLRAAGAVTRFAFLMHAVLTAAARSSWCRCCTWRATSWTASAIAGGDGAVSAAPLRADSDGHRAPAWCWRVTG